MSWVTVDKQVLAQRVGRSAARYDRAAVVQAEMAERLVSDVLEWAGTGEFESVLEPGCGTGLLTRRLAERCRIGRLVLNDLAGVVGQRLAAGLAGGLEVDFVPGDMEIVGFPGSYDLIVSNAAFQWVDDPGALIRRLTGMLRPGGVLAITAFGPENLGEVAELTAVSLRYLTLVDWRRMVETACDVLMAHEARRVMRFESASDVLRHLRDTGVNALDPGGWPHGKTRRLCRDYEARFGRNGEVPLTYHPLWLIGRKREGSEER
jgi:malonyl-ACP O-methyltransferase BioC